MTLIALIRAYLRWTEIFTAARKEGRARFASRSVLRAVHAGFSSIGAMSALSPLRRRSCASSERYGWHIAGHGVAAGVDSICSRLAEVPMQHIQKMRGSMPAASPHS